MEEALKLLWHVPTVMIVMLVAGLIMGQRHVGELSVFDLLTGIAIGAVAGAGIADPDLPHLPVLIAILGLAVFHYGVTVLIKKWPLFGRLSTFEPVVVVQNGQPVRSVMQKVRLSLSDLLPLLREKDVFDLRQVQHAILEPDGKVTVIKAPDAPQGAGLTRAVCVDGKIEHGVLAGLGWDEGRLRGELRSRGLPPPEHLFVVTLDDGGNLHAVPKDPPTAVPTIEH